MTTTSRISGKAILINFDELSGEQALLAEITIDCPHCGNHSLRIAGHHLRTLQRLLAEWIEDFPDLTGNESGIEVINRMKYGGTPPTEPRMN
jgi:hypothetical protein